MAKYLILLIFLFSSLSAANTLNATREIAATINHLLDSTHIGNKDRIAHKIASLRPRVTVLQIIAAAEKDIYLRDRVEALAVATVLLRSRGGTDPEALLKVAFRDDLSLSASFQKSYAVARIRNNLALDLFKFREYFRPLSIKKKSALVTLILRGYKPFEFDLLANLGIGGLSRVLLSPKSHALLHGDVPRNIFSAAIYSLGSNAELLPTIENAWEEGLFFSDSLDLAAELYVTTYSAAKGEASLWKMMASSLYPYESGRSIPRKWMIRYLAKHSNLRSTGQFLQNLNTLEKDFLVNQILILSDDGAIAAKDAARTISLVLDTGEIEALLSPRKAALRPVSPNYHIFKKLQRTVNRRTAAKDCAHSFSLLAQIR